MSVNTIIWLLLNFSFELNIFYLLKILANGIGHKLSQEFKAWSLEFQYILHNLFKSIFFKPKLLTKCTATFEKGDDKKCLTCSWMSNENENNSQRIKIRSMLNDIFTAGSSCRPTMADLWSLPNFSSIPPLRQIKEKSSRHVFPKIGDTFTYGTCSRNIQSWRKSSDLTGRITVGPIN
jgi:hypothetical protein